MWRGYRLHRSLKEILLASEATRTRGRSAVAAAAAAAVVSCSVILTAPVFSRQSTAEDRVLDNDSDGSVKVDIGVQNENSQLRLCSILSIAPISTYCERSEYNVQEKMHRISKLARHRTLKRMQDSSSRKSLKDRYKVQWSTPLGQGAFGAVYLATDRESGEKVAIKKISKKYTSDVGFQREMDALIHVRHEGGHPHICGLRENFEEADHFYLALDLVSGGEMFDHLVKMGAYSELDASRLIREVASALAFLHGIGVVHGDLKPENLMLSTDNASDSVIKIVDFGTASVKLDDGSYMGDSAPVGNTPAYSPPEVLGPTKPRDMKAGQDMWALGVILYIMLTGLHPFDLHGNATDEEIEEKIRARKAPPLRNSPITAHLSRSAIDLIERLMHNNPRRRITALQMLQHPWVTGEMAGKQKMADSDKRLSAYRKFKTRLEAQVFRDILSWSEDDDVSKRTSLIERSFRQFDPQQKGYITTKDLRRLTRHKENEKQSADDADDDATPLSLAAFSDLLSENMKNRYFPKGHVIYHEGQVGNHMYFINSGTIEVSTKEGLVVKLTQGDFFGEGALLHPKKIRSATISCTTPVHAIEISREYFDKYLAESPDGLKLSLKETDKTRKRERAKLILRLQSHLGEDIVRKGEYLFREGEKGNELYIVEEGTVDVTVKGYTVFKVNPGEMTGEHSLIFGRPRNTSAICRSESCSVLTMGSQDFNAFLDSHKVAREGLRDICLRREFQKALVFRTKKPFPTNEKDLKAAFDAVDDDSSGTISLKNVRNMLQEMDPTLTDAEAEPILKSLDLNDDFTVSFEEFKRIFRMDKGQTIWK